MARSLVGTQSAVRIRRRLDHREEPAWPTKSRRCPTTTTRSSRTSTRRRCSVHHDKHHQAYVDKANAALEGTELGRQADRGGPQEPRRAARRQAEGRAQQRRRPLQPLAVLGVHEPGRRRRARRRRSPTAINAAFGSFDDFKAKFKEAGVNQFGSGWAWLVHDGSGLAVVGTPNQDNPISDGPDAAAGRRRLGARLLPQVPEQAPRLPRRVVEHRQLGQGRRGLLGGVLSCSGSSTRRATPSPTRPRRSPRPLARARRALEGRARPRAVRAHRAAAAHDRGDRLRRRRAAGRARRGLAPVLDGFELSAPAAELARAQALPGARRIEAFDGPRCPPRTAPTTSRCSRTCSSTSPTRCRCCAEAARVARGVLVEVPLEDNRSAARPAKREEAARIGHLHEFSRADVRALLRGRRARRRRPSSTDPLPYAHHAFFAAGAAARATAAAKWAVRARLHRVAPAHARRRCSPCTTRCWRGGRRSERSAGPAARMYGGGFGRDRDSRSELVAHSAMNCMLGRCQPAAVRPSTSPPSRR